MKRTLSILLAVSGIATAADLEPDVFAESWTTVQGLTLHRANGSYVDQEDITNGSLTTGNATMTWTTTTSDQLTLNESWRLTFTLTNKTLDTADSPIFSTDTANSGANNNVLKEKKLTDSTYCLVFDPEGAQTPAVELNTLTLNKDTAYDITLTYIAKVNMQGVSEGGLFTISVADSEVATEIYTQKVAATDNTWSFVGSTSNTTRDYTRLWTNGGHQEFSNVRLEYNGKLIPEPTSSTLSMLALAGLAMRRRRK